MRTAASALALRVLLALLGTGACVPDAAGPAPQAARPSASARPSGSAPPATDAGRAMVPGDAGPLLAAPRQPVPEGPPKWKSVPKEQNGFFAVLDGICSQLGTGKLGKDVVVHYGGGSLDRGQREGMATFVALRPDGLESIGDPKIASPTGIAGASVDDFWIADSTGSRSSGGSILHRYANGKWKTYSKDQTNLHAWVDGGIIGTLGFAASNGDVWVEGSSTKPPLALHENMMFPALSAFPTGEVILVGRTVDERGQPSNGPPVARHWAPGKKVTEHRLDRLFPSTDAGAWSWLHEVTPDEVYAVQKNQVIRWDGSAWRALGKGVRGEIKRVHRAGPDDLWVLTDTGAVFSVGPTAASPVATPEPVADLDGLTSGGPWLVGTSGKLFKRETGTETTRWKPVALPPPVFSSGATLKAKGVVSLGPDDVILTAQYWEKGVGWKDQELHTALYRTKPVKETLRCNEPDPENNNIQIGRGLQSWPPIATAECSTPFVVLARRSKAVKNEDDWPRLRAAFKGHPELGAVALVDFVSGDRTFVGAKAKDLETAKKLAGLAGKNDRLRPEVVCGEPVAPVRTLALDLVTGNVVK